MSRDRSLYIDDTLTCCRKIRTYTDGMTREQFAADDKTYDAVARNLEIIGEAAKNIPPSIQTLMPEIDWRKPAGLRDVIAHAYFGIETSSSGMSSRTRSPNFKKPSTCSINAKRDSDPLPRNARRRLVR